MHPSHIFQRETCGAPLEAGFTKHTPCEPPHRSHEREADIPRLSTAAVIESD